MPTKFVKYDRSKQMRNKGISRAPGGAALNPKYNNNSDDFQQNSGYRKREINRRIYVQREPVKKSPYNGDKRLCDGVKKTNNRAAGVGHYPRQNCADKHRQLNGSEKIVYKIYKHGYGD